jgi:uncharacterized protein (TIGR02271 family)
MENRDSPLSQTSATAPDAKAAIPVIEEQLDIQKRIVDTGKGVRLHKAISEREETIDVPVRRETCDIQTIPINQILDEGVTPAPRVEGNTTVIPVVEEVIVLQKRLRLKEEIRITRRVEEESETHTVTLKSERVTVEHFDEKNESSSDKPLSNPLSKEGPGTTPGQ